MSLRIRTLWTVLLTVSILTLGLFVFSKTVLQESFQRLEMREADNNLIRTRNVVDEKFAYLEAKIGDWARWDDAYTFVQDGNEDFKTANLNDLAGGSLKINHLLYFDKDKNVKGKIGWDLVKEEPMAMSPAILDFFRKDNFFFEYSDLMQFKRGFVLFDGVPAFVVASAILTSEYKGPQMGTLVFINYVTPEEVARMSEVVRLPLASKNWNDIAAADGYWTHAKALNAKEPNNLHAVDDKIMIGHVLLHDWQNNPALVLQVKLHRDIMSVGLQTINYLISGVGLFALILCVTLLLTLETNVIRRIVDLTRQVRKIGEEGSKGSRVNVQGKDEITALSTDINRMLSSIEEKTKAIQSILDNVQFGLLLCDKTGKVLPGYSRSVSLLLQRQGEASLNGQVLWELLRLDPRELDNFISMYTQCFEESFIATELVSQIPARHRLGDTTLHISGSPLFDDNGEVESILFSIANITNLVKAENENEKNRSLLRILRSRDGFTKLVGKILAEGQEDGSLAHMRKQGVSEELIMKHVRRSLHTWKGDLSVYGMQQLAEVIHGLEDSIQTPHTAQTEIQRLGHLIQSFLADHRSLLGIEAERLQQKRFTVHSEQLDALRKAALEPSKNDLTQEVFQFLRDTRSRFASEVFGHTWEGALELAQRQRKKVKFVFEGDQIQLPDEYGDVYESFVHLFRNAIDHGIEAPDERKGKGPVANVSFKVTADPEGYCFELEDDGRGIDLEIIRSKILSKKLMTEAEWQALSEEEKIRVILKTGFTTRDVVSDVSGRGIGLDAVESSVATMNGSLKITSQVGKGTKVTVRLPRPDLSPKKVMSLAG